MARVGRPVRASQDSSMVGPRSATGEGAHAALCTAPTEGSPQASPPRAVQARLPCRCACSAMKIAGIRTQRPPWAIFSHDGAAAAAGRLRRKFIPVHARAHLRPKDGRPPAQPSAPRSSPPRSTISCTAKRDAHETPPAPHRTARAICGFGQQRATYHSTRHSLPHRETRRPCDAAGSPPCRVCKNREKAPRKDAASSRQRPCTVPNGI